MTTVPDLRVRRANEGDVNGDGDYVLYWMTAFRRLEWNFALQHAADLSRELALPLVILEILRADYPYASHRLHRFILQGMRERGEALAGTGVLHHPFVEERGGEAGGLVPTLASRAAAMVVDDFPSFFLPRMVEEATGEVDVAVDLVDANGLLPLRATEKVFKTARSFRRDLQETLPDHLPESPDPDLPARDLPPAEDVLSRDIHDRWPAARDDVLAAGSRILEDLPLDASVPSVAASGTSEAGRARLDAFLDGGLARYAEDARHPDREATSGLSPYLHFGLVSAHEIFDGVARREGWTPNRLARGGDGTREGWWGMGEGAEAFLDQLVTWRELGFNMTSKRDDYAEYDSLPEWARDTLEEHEADERPYLYSFEELRDAETHDDVWNAAQRQLLEEGVIHNYLRMLWGKKILEWTKEPREALDVMVELNDRFALDGRDPNSYSGIFWCLGRYDRGWPERPVFGTVRSMTSRSTRRKIHLDKYLDRFS
jgi:deoxyribodipyrimidine photo-lyase